MVQRGFEVALSWLRVQKIDPSAHGTYVRKTEV